MNKNRKLSKQCLNCQKYKEVDILDFLENKKSICNDCKIRRQEN